MSSYKTVNLSIGGKFFETTPETLRKSKYFCDLLDEDWDDNSTLFVDRDGFLFRFILLYLRTDEINVDRKHLKSLKNEADFYLIPKLSQLIERAMLQEQKSIAYKLLNEEELTRLYNVDGVTATSASKMESQSISFITSIQSVERVYNCPRGIIVHYNKPDCCGKACKKAKDNKCIEYQYINRTMYLVSVEANQ